MGVSGEDFLEKYDAGDYDFDGEDHCKLVRMEMLIPFVR